MFQEGWKGIKDDKKSFGIAMAVGGLVNAILTLLIGFVCLPCLFSDIIGAATTFLIAKHIYKKNR